MQMPFGKYQGRDIEEIPSDYLRWLAGHCDDEQIAERADAEYEWRGDYDAHWYEN